MKLACTAWLAILGLALEGCGGLPAAESPIQDAAEAVRIFERFWSADLLPGLKEPQKGFALALAYKVPANLGAAASTFEDVRREIDGSLMPEERHKLVLYGTPEALPREGACWRLESFGGWGSEIRACLDPGTGKVVLV